MVERKWSRGRDKLRKRRLAFDHYTCQACGHHDPTGKSLRLDELVPLALGGTETWDNSGTLCWVCNGIKGMSTMSYAEVGEVRARTRGAARSSFFSGRVTVEQAQPIISPRRRRRWR
jgi:5-methylcytosine-specific restriction endonuclease McrA